MDFETSPVLLVLSMQAQRAADDGSLPLFTRGAVDAALASPTVDAVVTSMEALYAALDGPSTAWLTLLADCAWQVNQYQWWGEAERAGLILGAVLRRLGEGDQDPALDPAPNGNLVPPPPEGEEPQVVRKKGKKAAKALIDQH